jgi:hypothetical protein
LAPKQPTRGKQLACVQPGAGDGTRREKPTVLSEMIKHHVKEEEQPGGMFAEAKKSDLDLYFLGQQLLERKQQLKSNAKAA